MFMRSILVALGGLVIFPAILAAQDLKIGYVDSEQIIRQAPGYQEASDAFTRSTTVWRDSLDAKRTQLQTLFEEYKNQEVILSPEKKTEKQQEMLQLEQDIQQYFQQKFGPEGEAGARQAELMQPIIEQVNQTIEDVRRDQGYSLIFDLNDGALVAGDPSLNITDQVIQRLRTSQPASAPSR